ncbi:MAG: type II toxin-antitoxin system prevent-host-death family antitoxin [Hyphomicrobiales bacterium]|nr:MAG: type II toxin-antitoxin system prevent-host-death family antitoxin [Hyphomicrobiales bacterium]
MKSVALAEAKAQLSALVDQVEAGHSICITRHGKPVAEIRPIAKVRAPIDFDALKQMTDSMTFQEEDGGTFMRRIRDEARY